ncbi:hypothetical protein KVV02_002089 [Mortierella alpina]|uniref:Yeast cell wall synthesis Kre9/Knh1-like N-terminal domain-containing protein n=1 Tax=Mortierella alpina TaxID=64518 RepID=A0A9P8A042_MORAP|nr:hypothetical protein KVV02_002089 [Mortierella alpina]
MHVSPVLFLATLLALATSVLADLTITAPAATSFVTAGSLLSITWTYSGVQPPVPPTISVELSKKLFTGPLALFSNLPTTAGTASWPIPKLGFVGNDFSIVLVANVNNQATMYAQGPTFAIRPEGTPPPADQSGGSGGGQHSSANRLGWRVVGQGAATAATSAALVWMCL